MVLPPGESRSSPTGILRPLAADGRESELGVMGHMNFEISVTDWAPELATSGAISPPRLPDTTDGPTAEMRPKLEVTETS